MTNLNILLPLYNDWRSCNILIKKINEQLRKRKRYGNILILDDASTQKTNVIRTGLKNIRKIKVLRLKKNLGSQKIISIGLNYIKNEKNKIIVLMDSDGEDDANKINNLVDVANKNKSYIVVASRVRRKEHLIFRILYKISEYFINLRDIEILFSNNLLKNYISKKTLSKSKLNFVFNNIKIKRLKTRKIDFLIYYRKHKNKQNFFPTILIKKLIKLKYKISIIGDKLSMPSIKNYGVISNSKVSKLQSIAKYTIGSGENPYSFFNLECISNNVKIIINKREKKEINYYKKNFVILDFSKLNTLAIVKKKIIKLND